MCAVADHDSLHKAARALGASQPTLTTQVRHIKRALGGALFTRHQEGSRPTALGHQLLVRARPLLTEMTALTAELRSAVTRTVQAPRVGSPQPRRGRLRT
ncbi:LysR family transcriptional regulator [Streptomyces longispororuber]|uniref:LysR family transcriptional regulator n=1 Tax=Streptomyces longispororuber TaxID=68230 RepID=UPI0036FDB1DD